MPRCVGVRHLALVLARPVDFRRRWRWMFLARRAELKPFFSGHVARWGSPSSGHFLRRHERGLHRCGTIVGGAAGPNGCLTISKGGCCLTIEVNACLKTPAVPDAHPRTRSRELPRFARTERSRSPIPAITSADLGDHDAESASWLIQAQWAALCAAINYAKMITRGRCDPRQRL
jgi:hypothetical protein